MDRLLHQIELLDAGDGRRLEAFGGVIVDRPAESATWPRRDPRAWASATARFDAGWRFSAPLPDPWQVVVDGLTLELRATTSGQVGLFPEHAMHWPWLRERIAEQPGGSVLHLFGSTGATTLALAAAGASVTHVDAARNVVAWARANAVRSGLTDRPVRWIVDDALAFTLRETRRGRRYAGIVLDPPSYGHGPGGRAWQLREDLGSLLDACRDVAEPDAFVLLTAHTPGEDGRRLAARLAGAFPDRASAEAGPLDLTARSGALLPLGAFARIMGT